MSWTRFPDERVVDEALLNEAERAAVLDGDESLMAIAEEDLVVDPTRPPSKHGLPGGDAGGALPLMIFGMVCFPFLIDLKLLLCKCRG